jgi:hypothetical protein
MKLLQIALFLTVLLGFGAISAYADSSVQFDLQYSSGDSAVDLFYDSLQPYGQWTRIPTYGWVWYPYGMPIDWRPYTGGRWVDTDRGWTFVSDEPWSWACYHYGRWYFDADLGWVWVPGTQWAPAWVVWRTNDDYIGWAPCPPRLAWRVGFGFDLDGVDLDDIVPTFAFCFVHHHDFFADDLDDFIILRARNVNICRETRPHIDLDFDRDHHFITNHMRDEDRLARELGHPFHPVKLVDADRFPTGAPRIENGQIPFFRPTINRAARDNMRIVEEPPAGRFTVPPDLRERQDAERRTLESTQADRERRIEVWHQDQSQHMLPGISSDQLRRSQDAERQALQDQMLRERHVLDQQHAREERSIVIPRPRFIAPGGPEGGFGPRGGMMPMPGIGRSEGGQRMEGGSRTEGGRTEGSGGGRMEGGDSSASGSGSGTGGGGGRMEGGGSGGGGGGSGRSEGGGGRR